MLSTLTILVASLAFPSFGVLKNAGSNGVDIVSTKTGTVFVAQSPEQFTHDADGNVTSNGRWVYTWDAENRLIGVETLTNLPSSVPRQRLEFAYDASFRRIRKQMFAWDTDHWSPVTDLRFVYDGWNMLAELDGTNAVVRSYVWGLDLSGSQTGAGGVGGLLFGTFNGSSATSSVACAFDGNGNVSALVDMGTGQVVATCEYSPFGEPIRASGSLAKENPFRFSTKFTDAETGLLCFGVRYYQPSTGGLLSRDLIEEFGGLNLCGFVHNDPISDVDPFGLEGLKGSGPLDIVNQITIPIRGVFGVVGSFLTGDHGCPLLTTTTSIG